MRWRRPKHEDVHSTAKTKKESKMWSLPIPLVDEAFIQAKPAYALPELGHGPILYSIQKMWGFHILFV